MNKVKVEDKLESTVEEKLRALYELQQIDSKIVRIRTIRGELPLEVSDLEDAIIGLETRIKNFTEESQSLEQSIIDKQNAAKEAQNLIKKHEDQQNKVRNNREYDSLTKEVEYQNLEIQLCEKRIKEYKAGIAFKNELIEKSQNELNERNTELSHKKAELESIVSETQKEEDSLLKTSNAAEGIIDERLLSAYKRIRSNTLNGLAVVAVERDACGGCFNKIPPQRQLDIRTHKKIIVCEHCGRVLVDAEISNVEKAEQ